MSRPITIWFYRPRTRAERIRARVVEALKMLGFALVGLAWLAGLCWMFYLIEVLKMDENNPRATRSSVLEVDEIDGARVLKVSHVNEQMRIDETTIATGELPVLELELEDDVRGVEHSFTTSKREAL